MTCPFLHNLSASFINRYSGTILKNYVNYCPAISRAYSSLVESSDGEFFTLKSLSLSNLKIPSKSKVNSP